MKLKVRFVIDSWRDRDGVYMVTGCSLELDLNCRFVVWVMIMVR